MPGYVVGIQDKFTVGYFLFSYLKTYFWLNNYRSFRFLQLLFWPVSQSEDHMHVYGMNIHFPYQIWIGHPMKPQYKGLIN